MDKAVAGSVPLCFVEQMPLSHHTIQVSHEESCNPTPILKDSGQDVSVAIQNCTEKQYFVSTATLSDVSQICSTVNTFPSVLMSPLQTQDKESACGITQSVLDKLHSVLLPNLSTTIAAALPQYTANNGQQLMGTNNNADVAVQPGVEVTSDLHSNLPVVQVSSSGITMLGTACDEGVPGQISCNAATNTNVLMTSDVSVLPVSGRIKNLSNIQLPTVELLMESSAGNNIQEDQEQLQIIELVQVASTHVYCVECNDSYIGGCNQHSTQYTHIPDSMIESHARASLPKCLYLMDLNRQQKSISTGVFCGEDIPAKTLFGPLEGVLSSEPAANKSNTWQLFQNGSTAMYLDCSSEEKSNWIMFMRRASNNAEQNVVVYQQGLELYYVTSKCVVKGQELLYWYSAAYAQLLGLPKRPDLLLYCNICHEQFVSLDAISGHKKKMHPNPTTKRRFCCPVCQKAFTSRHKVDVHMTKHTKVKPFACAECGKGFTDKSNLRKHMKIHNGEKNYKCFYCAKQFRQKAHLDTHIVIHTGEKQLMCKYCGKKFARQGDLKQHTYIHTNERNLQCSVCCKVFHRRQNLNKHMKLHSVDSKRLPCLQCGKRFADKYHRSRHSATCKGIKVISKTESETRVELESNTTKKNVENTDYLQNCSEIDHADIS